MTALVSRIPPSDLRCPCCKAALRQRDQSLTCTSCAVTYPMVGGIPVMIDERTSVSRLSDYTAPHHESPRPILRRLREKLPSLSGNIGSEKNFARFTELLLAQTPTPRVLVLGGRVLGDGMKALVDTPGIELVETDICPGPRVQILCDAHQIPFDDSSFDAVIIQAVLEHVCAPHTCVAEIHRVLKPRGLVYAETPFMQQVHGGAYDFTRFTDLGHRRLFRHFEEIERGACCGPGMALAWAIQYFLLSCTGTRFLRGCVRIGCELSLFWLKYIDRFIIHRPEALDAASGFYFLGRRSDTALSDRELIPLWRGRV